MDIITLVQVVLRRWWLLVLLGLVGLVSAYVVSTSLPKHYQSTVTLQLNASAKSAFLPYTSETSPLVALAASYSEVLRSRAFGEVVVQRLQLPVSPDAVAGAIKAQQIPNTNILRITVQWDHPQDARQLAQSVAEIFISENLRRQQAQPGAQSRLAEMEESVRTLQTRIDVLAQQRNRLDQAVARGDLSRLAELKDIETRLSGFEASYANLLVEINRIRGGLDTAAILDNATPGAPAGDLPLQMALLLGLFGGLGVAVGVAFGLEYLGDALQGPEEVVAVCGSAPFAAVSHIGSRSRKGGEAQATTSPLVLLDDPRSPPAEAIRALRTNLRFATLDRPLGTLVVTSPGPNEGKTLIASNLAIAWAKEGKRVLLVDADLRRPSIHTLFGIENTCGFTEAIAGIADCG
ncbi:MAG: hypothetical protein HY690_06045, partial [Chloroflexi bacterium]|nr:hypothetical protein [Chloroflexota bacterium]